MNRGNQRSTDYDYTFKFVIVGDANVGKSCLLHRYTDDEFSENYQATLGVDFKFKTISTDGKTIKIQIWDTAGQERFKTIISSYYKGSHAIFICYDITSQSSFDKIDEFWYPEVVNNNHEDSQIVILGTKKDLEHSERQVTDLQVQKYAADNNLKHFIVSSKTGENVHSSIESVIRKLVEQEDRKSKKDKDKNKKLNNGFNSARNKNRCCD